MARDTMPFAGDATQAFKIFTPTFSAVGSQFGFINIYNARTSAPEVEAEMLEEVGSYGKQIGHINDVPAALLARPPVDAKLETDDRKAIARFQVTLEQINAIKKSRGRKPLRVGEGS